MEQKIKDERKGEYLDRGRKMKKTKSSGTQKFRKIRDTDSG